MAAVAAQACRPQLADCDVRCADVASVPYAAGRPTACAATCTAAVQAADAACQAREQRDAAAQAGPGAAAASTAAAGGAPAESQAELAAAAAALGRALPRMLEALAEGPPRPLGGSAVAAPSSSGGSVGVRQGPQALAAQLLHTLCAGGSLDMRCAPPAQAPQRGARAGAAAGGKQQRPLGVTALAWNQTGGTLAAAYGRLSARGWCSEPGAVAVWSHARLGQQGVAGVGGRPAGSKAAAATAAAPVAAEGLLATESWATAVAFHPTEPALLAGGCFNGEVVLWDLSCSAEEDARVARTDVLGEARHREPVTALAWQRSAAEARRRGGAGGRGHVLLSLGADGRLLVWAAAGGKLDNPTMGYELRCPQPSLGGLNSSQAAGALILPGATSMSLAAAGSSSGGQAHGAAAAAAALEGSAFVATEGGSLLRCQLGDADDSALRDFAARFCGGPAAAGALASAGPAGAGGEAPGGARAAGKGGEMRSAVRDASYERCAGAVTGVAVSPFLAQAVAACGMDGSLRLFNGLRGAPVVRAYAPGGAPLCGVQWSPTHPLVIVAATGNGQVLVYDLSTAAGSGGLLAPALTLAVGGSGGGTGARTAVAFNPAAPGLLAAAAGGEVQVWRLPAALTLPGSGAAQAQRALGRLAQQATVE